MHTFAQWFIYDFVQNSLFSLIELFGRWYDAIFVMIFPWNILSSWVKNEWKQWVVLSTESFSHTYKSTRTWRRNIYRVILHRFNYLASWFWNGSIYALIRLHALRIVGYGLYLLHNLINHIFSNNFNVYNQVLVYYYTHESIYYSSFS